MSQIRSKLDGIYELARKKKRRQTLSLVTAVASLIVMLVSGSIATMSSRDGGPIWTQSLTYQITSILMFVSVAVCMISIEKSKIVPFEKRNFIKLYDAYKCLARYNSLVGSSSQEDSDLSKAEKLVQDVSSTFVAMTGKSVLSDIGKEIHASYNKLGRMIQTRLLTDLQRRENLPLVEEKLLELADTFADISFGRLSACTEVLKKLPESGVFQPKPSFLRSHSRLRSSLMHIGKFLVSSAIVVTSALFLSQIFQRPMSEFAPYILTSIFVLYVAWEFKS